MIPYSYSGMYIIRLMAALEAVNNSQFCGQRTSVCNIIFFKPLFKIFVLPECDRKGYETKAKDLYFNVKLVIHSLTALNI